MLCWLADDRNAQLEEIASNFEITNKRIFNVAGRMFKPARQACPWECHSYWNPMGNVPWDGTSINCYGMGMGQINMSHGQP